MSSLEIEIMDPLSTHSHRYWGNGTGNKTNKRNMLSIVQNKIEKKANKKSDEQKP